MKCRIGIDVGGTNTDAVVLGDTQHGILSWKKSPTTTDVTDGIAAVLGAVLESSRISSTDITYVSIGTTHFVNAVIEADPAKLAKVAVIRLAGPYTRGCPPFIDFPPTLRKTIEGHVATIDGGLQIDGKEILPIKDDQILEQCRIIREKGLRHIVLVGVFSPLCKPGEQEQYVRDVIANHFEGSKMEIVCSKDVGHVGLLERENAAILNASILSFARETIQSYRTVLKRLHLDCPLYLTQLDGTLVNSKVAVETPIRTFSNGPTNSMRGASYLAKLDDRAKGKSVIVVDVGGTTTDVGVLLPSGLPRKAAAFTEVGGVRTSFSMPDIHSIGLGGGSYVFFDADGTASVGPSSVGHHITSAAKVFGGRVLTATDLAVAAGLHGSEEIGDKSLLHENSQLTPDSVDAGINTIRKTLEAAIDRMKTDAGDATVLLVGGGSVIVPPDLKGVQEVIRPSYFNVANAVGAAIGRVSGTVDRVEIPGNRTVEEIVDTCKNEAIQAAVRAGADPHTTSIAEVAVVQLPYVANHASRIIVKAIGDLDLDTLSFDDALEEEVYDIASPPIEQTITKEKPSLLPSQPTRSVNIFAYEPSVSTDGVWTLSEIDIEWIAEGCAILGCGGGGATYAAYLMGRQAVRSGHKIKVVDIDYVLNVGPDAWVVPCGFMGSPSVSSERIPSGEEIPTAARNAVRFLGVSTVTALLSDEIGGKNGLEPMLLATKADFNLPVVDADLMGRAYPRLDQILPCISKKNGLFPVVAADGVGNCMIVPSAENNAVVEDILRATCTVLGSSMGLSISPLRARELKEHSISGSTSQAWRIGRAVAYCRKRSTLNKVAEAIIELQDGRLLFVGKIVAVQREVRGGFTHGKIIIIPLSQEEMEGPDNGNQDDYPGTTRMAIPFQNENLLAEVEEETGSWKTVCCVPDLITVLDAQNGSAIGTQDYRYGLRVVVIGLACHPRWASPAGLKLGGPSAFGFDESKYSPIGAYKSPKSVITEFRAN